jgi:hypothetical protein
VATSVCLDFLGDLVCHVQGRPPALDALAPPRRVRDVRFLAVNIDRDGELADRFLTERLPVRS